MYISSNTANIIKSYAKIKDIAIKDLLEACDLNKNTLSTMTSRGSWIQADSLAKIADYLDCSVDYLLGRNEQNTMADTSITTQEKSLLNKYKKLNTLGKEKADEYIVDLTEQDKYTRHEKRQEKLNA